MAGIGWVMHFVYESPQKDRRMDAICVFFRDVKEYVENIQWRMKIISVNTPGGS